MTATANFKAFKGGKSKARKGLARFSELLLPRESLLLSQDADGEWGFDLDQAQGMLDQMTKDEAATKDSTQAAAEYVEPSESEDEHATPAPAPSMFANIGATLGAVAGAPAATTARAPAASRTNYTIEKDRPEQNGIKRPSAGGLCRAVWDAMDDQRTANNGDTPSTQQVRDLALMHNWNTNNAMIEYYQWRKYNGITGRTAKKVEAAPATETV